MPNIFLNLIGLLYVSQGLKKIQKQQLQDLNRRSLLQGFVYIGDWVAKSWTGVTWRLGRHHKALSPGLGDKEMKSCNLNDLEPL